MTIVERALEMVMNGSRAQRARGDTLAVIACGAIPLPLAFPTGIMDSNGDGVRQNRLDHRG
jgi:hypothetical protein